MNKIIWAVDISHDASESHNMVKELRRWAKKMHGVIQPVAVVSSSMFNLPLTTEYPWQQNFNQNALLLFQRYLRQARATDFKSPHIISSPTSSHRKMAQELVQYATKEKASFIFAHTRAHSHWNPLRLGGFAEALAATSPIPVLLLNLKTQTPIQINSILLPTDLSPASHRTLQQLASVANAFHSKIMLYNQVEDIPMYLPIADNLTQKQLNEIEVITQSIEKDRHKKIQRWVQQLQHQGINSLKIIQRQKTYLGKDILAVAKAKKAQLIALTSDTGLFSQASLSSSIKDIILQARSPVLIFNRVKTVRKRTEKPLATRHIQHVPEIAHA